jgi:RND family efflux transporter MFP subunit
MESQFLLGLRTLRIYASSFQPRTLGLGALSAAPGGAATLRAPTAGSLEAAPGGFPGPGSVVKAGQLLALLREAPSSVDRAALLGQQADAETRLATARASLRLAQRDLEQVDSLGPALTERERMERRNAVEVATVEVREAERAANGAGLLLPIHAPLSGRLALEMARPGDTVEAGADLFHVVSNDTLWLRARVPEAQATRIERGSAAEVLLPSIPGRSFSAILLDDGLEADPQTGTVTVTLALAPDPQLRSGLAATAWIAVGAAEDVLSVPDDAVVESNGSTLVFVKTGPERFEAREVSLGARSGKSWEVHAGLRPAERVVVAGTYALKSLAGR